MNEEITIKRVEEKHITEGKEYFCD